ncbi:30S ribosomal protein S20 [Candidatus Cardinium hertigii]|jgi:small subunit ribosomal protein S20|uniref:Small ribosomal subunit protein bS20 n=1 Tax=Candidatus Cardinium hertigii TaxID=247481 RepID=A0A3N2QBW5_9BACT|nr:30S ribosomal protein S20 [Candidatus Cardinium hertigii]ROT47308.1 30S ribosomal protein S20 [Candidatus Cardinium hertigii]
MTNHKSAEKRIRSNHTKYLRNRYQLKTCRTYIKKVKKLTDKMAAAELLPSVFSMIDKLAAKNIVHKNKSANSKAKLAKYVNGLTPGVD